jgi:hypothetical protein
MAMPAPMNHPEQRSEQQTAKTDAQNDQVTIHLRSHFSGASRLKIDSPEGVFKTAGGDDLLL